MIDYDEMQAKCPANIIIERIGPDPFGRGWPTVFYRNVFVNALEIFYCAVHNWKF